MIICLAFLPISDLAAALTVLEACLPNQLQQVFDWFVCFYFKNFLGFSFLEKDFCFIHEGLLSFYNFLGFLKYSTRF